MPQRCCIHRLASAKASSALGLGAPHTRCIPWCTRKIALAEASRALGLRMPQRCIAGKLVRADALGLVDSA